MRRVVPLLTLVFLASPAMAQDADRPSVTAPPAPQAIERQAEPQVIEPSRASPGFAITGGDWRASKLIGANVLNVQDRSIGEIEDIILDNDGKVVSVLVSAGGFLGLGEKQVAITFKDLTMSRDEDGDTVVRTSLSQQALETAPDVATD